MKNYLNYLLLLLSLIKVFDASNSMLLKGSHLNHRSLDPFETIDNLNPSLNLTLTLVTGSLANTHLVSEHFPIFSDHKQLKSTVSRRVMAWALALESFPLAAISFKVIWTLILLEIIWAQRPP
jgi:hypothetical protein